MPSPATKAPFLPASGLPEEALRELARSVEVLERRSFTLRLAALAGAPIEALKARLPRFAQRMVDGAARRALTTALKAALRTGPARRAGWLPSAWLHRGLALASGVAGGAFGLPGTLAELPAATGLLLRQIAAVAAEEGEDLSDPAVAAECLKVFALGSWEPDDGAPDGSDYFAARMALSEAGAHRRGGGPLRRSRRAEALGPSGAGGGGCGGCGSSCGWLPGPLVRKQAPAHPRSSAPATGLERTL